ncbi:MAG: DUF4159 domain-containing protein, partial [Planctomycetes bacterium]|nr:DUF4159 domain-containing protein [Planctomycetota bacterium]
MRRFILLACMTGVLLASADVGYGRPRPEFSDQAVEKAIAKAVDFIWKSQRRKGNWAKFSKKFPVGNSAIAVYALLESGVSIEDPRMAKALRYLESAESLEDQTTYNLGLRANAWAAAAKQDEKYYALLRKDVARIVKSTADGSYDYHCNADQKSTGDSSNSQYGVLGAWAGSMANMEIPQQYWWKVANHWISIQNADGGWPYRVGEKTRYTMTAGGMVSLFICYDNLLAGASDYVKCRVGEKTRLTMAPIERGLEWYAKGYEELLEGQANRPYFLYGVERVALAGGYKYFGRVDWYKHGAAIVTATQSARGDWGGGDRTLSNACFCLLFLVRGRNTVLFNKLKFDGDWNNRPRALTGVTHWLSKTMEKTFNWQIIDLAAPVEEWHDAPILFISGSNKAPVFTDDHIKRLRTFVNQGGTIFSVAECRGDAFKKGMRQAYERM